MQTTTTTLFNKAERWCAYIFTTAFIFTFLLLMTFAPYQSTAQQSLASYPLSLDLNLGSGLIGNPSVSPAFQPELGFSYMPGKLGAGLNAGFISYNSSFNADQYASGFEDFTSITKNGEKWTSFFMGIGPRFEFGSGSRLPITFRSSLDLALTYNSPPKSSVDFNDPTGSYGDSQLQLSGFNPGDNYSKWSTSLRPEFQIQFSPGGSDRFAINVTTGIQHRLTKNEFTYTQKDLSKVRRMDNPQEMFFQFDNAPEIQRSAAPPQTNFFTSVGIKIKFGKHKGMSAPAQDYNSSRSNKPNTIADGVGDGDADSDGDGIDDAIETAQDYNAARSNKPTSRAGDIGDCDDSDSDRCIKPGERSSNDADSDADGIDDGTNKTTPPTTDVYIDGKLHKICNRAPEMDPISQSATYSEFQEWLAHCENYGTGDVGDYPPVDEAYSQFTSRVNLKERFDLTGTIITTGSVIISSHPDSPIYEGDAIGGENILNKGEMNDSSEDDFNSAGVNSPIYEMADAGGNGDGDNNTDPLPSQIYDMQPSSYCVEVATMKMSTNSQKAMRNSQNGDMNTDDTAMATSHNASRSNRSSGIKNDDTNTGDIDTESDSTGLAPATSHNASRSNRSQGVTDQDGDTDINTDSTRISNATDYNSSRSNTTSSVVNPDNTGDGLGNDSTRIANATDYNSSRSNTTSSIADIGGDLDGDGFPDLLENASLTMTKRKRPGRAKYGDITLKKSMNNAGGTEEDNFGDIEGLQFDLNMEPEILMTLVADPLVAPGNTDGSGDFDDGNGLMDVLESATYSISKRSARTGRTAMKNDQENPLAKESGWQETPVSEFAPPDDVYQWTYKLNALSDNEDLPGNGTLTLIMSGGKVHFNVLFDPDSDEDGYSELLKNSSFSISKRSARTGRNPQSGRE